MTIVSLRWIVPFFCLLTVACAGNMGRNQLDLSIVQVAAGQDALGSGTGFESELISDQGRLLAVWKGLRQNSFKDSGLPVPEIDFSRSHLLFLSMGKKPTAGYRIVLDAEKLTFADHMAVVRVLWQEPTPDSIQAQMVTTPYLLLKLPKLDVRGVRVLDQNHKTREEVLFPRHG